MGRKYDKEQLARASRCRGVMICRDAAQAKAKMTARIMLAVAKDTQKRDTGVYIAFAARSGVPAH